MGIVYYTRDGRTSSFRISGDEPTATEQQRINDIMNPTVPSPGLFAGISRDFQILQMNLSRLVGDEAGVQRNLAQAREAYPENAEPLSWFNNLLAGTVSNLVYPAAAGLAGLAVAGPVGAAIGVNVGRGLGAGAALLASTAQFGGHNAARQYEQTGEVNQLTALLTAVPQAMMDLYSLKAGAVGTRALAELMTTGQFRERLAGAIVQTGVTAVREGFTEFSQQVLERVQAGLPLDTPDAIEEFKQAALGGLALGGVFGGAASVGRAATANPEKRKNEQLNLDVGTLLEGRGQRPRAEIQSDMATVFAPPKPVLPTASTAVAGPRPPAGAAAKGPIAGSTEAPDITSPRWDTPDVRAARKEVEGLGQAISVAEDKIEEYRTTGAQRGMIFDEDISIVEQDIADMKEAQGKAQQRFESLLEVNKGLRSQEAQRFESTIAEKRIEPDTTIKQTLYNTISDIVKEKGKFDLDVVREELKVRGEPELTDTKLKQVRNRLADTGVIENAHRFFKVRPPRKTKPNDIVGYSVKQKKQRGVVSYDTIETVTPVGGTPTSTVLGTFPTREEAASFGSDVKKKGPTGAVTPTETAPASPAALPTGEEGAAAAAGSATPVALPTGGGGVATPAGPSPSTVLRPQRQANSGIDRALRASFKKFNIDKYIKMDIHEFIDTGGTGAIAEGAFDSVKKIITLAHGLYKPGMTEDQVIEKMISVMNHEVIHAVRELGLISDTEWKSLVTYISNKKMKGKLYTYLEFVTKTYEQAKLSEDGLHEEAVAESFRAWAADPTVVVGQPAGLFRRIAKFFLGIGEAADASVEVKDFFERLARGDVGNRPVTAAAPAPTSGNTKFSISSYGQPPVFYSSLSRAVENLKTTKMPAQQWMATIKNSSGVKSEEIKWLGLEEFFKAKGNASVTKEEVIAHINENNIEVNEVIHGGNETVVTEEQAREFFGIPVDVWVAMDDERRASYVEEVLLTNPNRTKIRYQTYTIGGTSSQSGYTDYRELLLILKDSKKDVIEAKRKKLKAELASIDMSQLMLHEAKIKNLGELRRAKRENTSTSALEDEFLRYKERDLILVNRTNKIYDELDTLQVQDTKFETAHWGESNVLAHIRFNTRIVGNKKVLFIEEIQSDWHQTGKKEGYGEIDEWGIYAPDGTLQNSKLRSKDAANEALTRFRTLYASNKERDFSKHTVRKTGNKLEQLVPDAPFKDTTAWTRLALTRMLRWAADNNFNYVAWAPGNIHNDRYPDDYRQKIKEITWEQRPVRREDLLPQGALTVDEVTVVPKDATSRYITLKIDKSTGIVKYGEFAEKKLSDVLGKSAADRILAAENGVIKNEDLWIGGEAFKEFYDKILVNVANDIGKKFGARTEKLDITVPVASNGVSGTEVMTNMLMIPAYQQGEYWSGLDPTERDNIVDRYRAMKTTITAPAIPITDSMKGGKVVGPKFSISAGFGVDVNSWVGAIALPNREWRVGGEDDIGKPLAKWAAMQPKIGRDQLFQIANWIATSFDIKVERINWGFGGWSPNGKYESEDSAVIHSNQEKLLASAIGYLTGQKQMIVATPGPGKHIYVAITQPKNKATVTRQQMWDIAKNIHPAFFGHLPYETNNSIGIAIIIEKDKINDADIQNIRQAYAFDSKVVDVGAQEVEASFVDSGNGDASDGSNYLQEIHRLAGKHGTDAVTGDLRGKIENYLRNYYANQEDTLEFKAWFRNSKVLEYTNTGTNTGRAVFGYSMPDNVDNLKNILANLRGGKPARLYHSTMTNEFGDEIPFWVGQHFGTKKSARDRFNSKMGGATLEDLDVQYGDGRYLKPNPSTFPVWLRIENPFPVYDLGEWEAKSWALQFENAGEFTQEEIDSVRSEEVSPHEILLDHGYDGYVYINVFEDPGSITWSPIKSDTQVKSATGNDGAFNNDDSRIKKSLSYSGGGYNGELILPREIASYRRRGLITPSEADELKNTRDNSIIEKRFNLLVRVFESMPSVMEFAVVADYAKAARDWYIVSRDAIRQVFGADAERFAALVGSLAPVAGVTQNTNDAVKVWTLWLRNGRPHNKETLEAMIRSLPSKMMDSRSANVIRVLSQESSVDFQSKISGPKVQSFYYNLFNDPNEVTLDTWMLYFIGIGKDSGLNAFGESMPATSILAGSKIDMNIDNQMISMQMKNPAYIAYSAKIRETAQLLTRKTKTLWTPDQVQAAVWSFTKVLWDKIKKGQYGINPDFSNVLADTPPETFSKVVSIASQLLTEANIGLLNDADPRYANAIERAIRSHARLRNSTGAPELVLTKGHRRELLGASLRRIGELTEERNQSVGVEPLQLENEKFRNNPRAWMTSSIKVGESPMSVRSPTKMSISYSGIPLKPLPVRGGIEGKIIYTHVSRLLNNVLVEKLPFKNKELVRKRIDNFLVNVQNKTLQLEKIVDWVSFNNGDLKDEFGNDIDPAKAIELADSSSAEKINDKNKAGGIIHNVLDAVNKIKFTESERDSVARINKKAEKFLNSDTYTTKGNLFNVGGRYQPDLPMFDLYLAARHAPFRNAQIRAKKGSDPEKESGFTDEESAEIVGWFNANSKIGLVQKAETDYRILVKDLNAVRKKFHLIPKEFDDGTTNLWTPLRGFLEEDITDDEYHDLTSRTGTAHGARGREDPKALGRESMGVHMVAHTILMNEVAEIRGARNIAAIALEDMAIVNKAKGLNIDQFYEVLAARPKERVEVGGRIKEIPISTRSLTTDAKHRNEYIVYKRDGKEKIIWVHEDMAPGLADAMNNTIYSTDSYSWFVKGLLGFNRFLQSVIIKYSPEFMINNSIRDFLQASIMVKQYDVEGISKLVRQKMWGAMKATRAGIRDLSKLPDPKMSQHFLELRHAGGLTSSLSLNTLETTVQEMMNEERGNMLGAVKGGSQRTNLGKGFDQIKKVGKFVEDYNRVAEAMTRLAVFSALRDSGFSITDAAQAAKNATVNFDRGGKNKSLLSALYLFFNANMQGSFNLFKGAIKSKKIRQTILAITAAGVVQDVMNSMIGGLDDDDNPIYDKIPEWQLRNSLIFMDFFGITDRGYFHIPLPWGFSAAFNFGRTVSRYTRGGYSPGEAMGSVATGILNSFNPLGTGASLLSTITPTFADPAVELISNRDFAGRPISPTQSPFGVQRPDSHLSWSSTSGLFTGLAEGLNRLTGGTPMVPGFIDVSPETLEYWASFIFGATGQFARRTINLAVDDIPAALSGAPNEMSINDIPIVRKFLGNVSSREDMEAYIENRDRVLQVRAEIQDARDNNDPKRAAGARARWPEEASLASRINRLENQRTDLNGRIRDVQERVGLTPESRARQLELLMKRREEIIRRGNELMQGI